MQSQADSYAQLQGSLRRAYWSDLLQMAGALRNVLKELPHHAGSLRPRLQLVEGAVAMLTTPKAAVNDADMAALVDLGPKVHRVAEQWRARLRERSLAGKPLVVDLSGPAATAGQAEAQMASPFQLQPPPAVDGGGGGGGGGGANVERALHLLHDLERLDSVDYLTSPSLSADPACLPALSMGTSLPTIDWDVPMVKPSGNLDQLLASEASEVLQLQQIAAQREGQPAAGAWPQQQQPGPSFGAPPAAAAGLPAMPLQPSTSFQSFHSASAGGGEVSMGSVGGGGGTPRVKVVSHAPPQSQAQSFLQHPLAGHAASLTLSHSSGGGSSRGALVTTGVRGDASLDPGPALASPTFPLAGQQPEASRAALQHQALAEHAYQQQLYRQQLFRARVAQQAQQQAAAAAAQQASQGAPAGGTGMSIDDPL